MHVKMHVAGFEPASLATTDLESDPLDHSGTHAHIIRDISWIMFSFFFPLSFSMPIFTA